MNERELAELLRNNPDLQVDEWPTNNAQIDGTRVVPVRAAKMPKCAVGGEIPGLFEVTLPDIRPTLRRYDP